MNTELQEFFSLIGKAKKEKDDEFKSLVGDINIDSVIFRSATYQIQITEGTNYNMTTINAIHDGSVTYMSEYGTINQPVGIATFSTDINSGFLRLLAYPNSSNTTTFKVILTAIQS